MDLTPIVDAATLAAMTIPAVAAIREALPIIDGKARVALLTLVTAAVITALYSTGSIRELAARVIAVTIAAFGGMNVADRFRPAGLVITELAPVEGPPTDPPAVVVEVKP